MQYRLCQPTDFLRLYEIEMACFPAPIRFPRLYLRDLLENPRSAAWVAVEESGGGMERLAGFAIVDWRRSAGQPVAYIETLEVAPEYRRLGVGTGLLEHTIVSACEAGAVSICLHVDENNHVARRLYQRHAFVEQGREEHYYRRDSHAIVYARSLEPCRRARTR